MNRETQLAALRENSAWDVLIIGGGVNGIGTFRDLALNGVRVLLAEKGDFCSGASAASSHMLHGGIRYLENGEFRLVREALHERNRLLKNAPHYARPLPTTIPMFRWFSGLFNAPLKFLQLLDRPAERGAVVIKAGLIMYDWFTRNNRATPTHEFTMKKASLEKYPHLNPDIICTASYYDAWMPYPERLCLDMILDAHAASDEAVALNYLSAVAGEGDSVTLRDEVTGEEYTVQPKVVINAAGPWIDFVNRAMNEETQFIGGTKGSHLILDNPELHEACNGHEFFFENEDGRIVLIFPFMNRVMVGTTDIRIDNPDDAVCTDEEIDYILKLIPRVFPNLTVDRSQIVYTFSGVRPLPHSGEGRTGAISRDHSLKTIPPGEHFRYPVHSLIGGKWTSFRAFSEEAADVALGNLDKGRTVSTEHLSIGGGRGYPVDEAGRERWLQQLQARSELPLERLRVLFERYGTYAEQVANYISAGNDVPLAHVPGYSRREVLFIAENEAVVHVSDVLQRRSLIAMLGYATPEAIQEVAAIVGEAQGWSPERVQDEIQQTQDMLREKHRV